MPSPNIRYGLDLDRGLYFEGRLSTTNAQRLGAYMLASVTDPERASQHIHRLDYLQGAIIGIDAKSTTVPEKRRTITDVPAIGTFSLTSISRVRADLVENQPQAPREELSIEGTGILHIPKLRVFQKYRNLFPKPEYLTQATDINDDSFLIYLNKNKHLEFSISVAQ